MGNDIVSAQTAAQTKYAIPDITWETTHTYDFGIDANFLNDRLRFTGDYYKKTTSDMLLALEIPDYIGYDNPDQIPVRCIPMDGKLNLTGMITSAI